MVMKWLAQFAKDRGKAMSGKDLPDIRGRTPAQLTTEELEAHFKAGAQQAHDEALNAELPVIGELDGELVRKYPDGRVERIESVRKAGREEEVDLDLA